MCVLSNMMLGKYTFFFIEIIHDVLQRRQKRQSVRKEEGQHWKKFFQASIVKAYYLIIRHTVDNCREMIIKA